MATHKIHPDFPLQPREIRHIKLGAGNCWAETAIARNEIVFGDAHIPHDLAAAGHWDEVRRHYRRRDANDGAAANHTRELKDFYTLGSDCLWVTFVGPRLYWGFAEPEVRFDPSGEPPRVRKIVGKWRHEDAEGQELNTFRLSSAITCTRGSQATISTPSGAKLCLAKINAEVSKDVATAKAQELELAATALRMIRTLDQSDLEILVARMAEADGWRIESAVGGSQPIVDFIARQPAADLEGYFQVKARASRKEVEAFISSARRDPKMARLIFATHDDLSFDRQAHPELEIWAGIDLALRALRVGLLPWIMRRTA